MRRSLRRCGKGGMFSFTGWYHNDTPDNFRAFVTDSNRTVVLKYATRTIVVSPERPEKFAAEIENQKKS